MENQLKKEIERKYAERKKAANAKSEYYRQQLFNDESYVNALNLRNCIKFSLSKAKYAGNLEEIEKNEKKLAEAQADLCTIAARLGITKSMLTINPGKFAFVIKTRLKKSPKKNSEYPKNLYRLSPT